MGQKATEPGRLSPGTSGNDSTFSQAVPVRSVSYTRKGSQKVTPEDIGKEPTNSPTQKGRQAGDSVAMELEGGDSEKSDATAGAVYAVVDKKRKEGERAMAASEIREFELEKSAATAGAVYTVLDKTKKAPPPLPPPYQPGDRETETEPETSQLEEGRKYFFLQHVKVTFLLFILCVLTCIMLYHNIIIMIQTIMRVHGNYFHM